MSMTVLLVDDHPLMRCALRNAIETISEDACFIPAASLEEACQAVRLNTPPDFVILDLNLPDACGTATLDAFGRRFPGLKLVVLSERTDAPTIQAARKAGAIGFIPKTASVDQVITSLRQMISSLGKMPPAPSAAARTTPDATSGASTRSSAEQEDGGLDLPAHACQAAAEPATATQRMLLGPRPAGMASSHPVHRFAMNTAMNDTSPMASREHHDGRHLGLTERQRSVLQLMMLGMPNKVICRELKLAEGTVKVHVSAVLRALGVASRAQVTAAALRAGIEMSE